MQILCSQNEQEYLYPLGHDQLNGTFTHKSKSILTTRVRAHLNLRVQARVCALHISAIRETCMVGALNAMPFLSFQFHQMNFFSLLNMWYPFNKSRLIVNELIPLL